VNPSNPYVIRVNAFTTQLPSFQLQVAILLNGFGAAPNNCMVVNGRAVCPSPIDKYNFLHPGKTNYRDSNSRCSQHTTVDNKTGQVQNHIDEFNPNDYFIDHVILDVIPDVIYDITGQYLFPTGNQFCP
jgi:hypothetical protein